MQVSEQLTYLTLLTLPVPNVLSTASWFHIASGGARTSRQPGHFQVSTVVTQVIRCELCEGPKVKISVSQGASQGRSSLATAFDLVRPGVAPPLHIAIDYVSVILVWCTLTYSQAMTHLVMTHLNVVIVSAHQQLSTSWATECVDFSDVWNKHFVASSIKDLFDNVKAHSIIDFIKETRFYKQL